MELIKVLFVQPVLAPYSVQRYKALASCEGLKIHVALEADTLAERPGWKYQLIEGCEVDVLSSIRYQKSFRAKERSFTDRYTKVVPYGLVGKIWKIRPAAVVVCNPTEFLFALIARIGSRFALGLILEDTPTSELRKSPLVQLARKWLFQHADFVFCFSKDAQYYAKQVGVSGRQFRSSWSIDSDWYRRSGEQLSTKLRSKSGYNPVTRFVYVGALSERKGVRALLHAWQSFTRTVSDASLIMVGDGSLAQELQDYCANNNINSVEFTGHLPYEEICEYYLDADVFILPTLEDLFSLVVTEAMAFGLPVLTTIYNGARELVEDGVNGYIFDPMDNSEFISVLFKTYENRSSLSEMGANSRKRIGEYTHNKIMADMCRDIHLYFQ